MRKLLIAVMLVLVCAVASADVIHFIDGTKLKGRIVSETKDMIVLDTGKERIPIQKSVIKRIERDSPAPKPKPKPEPKPVPKPKQEPVEEEKQVLTEEQQKEADAISRVLKKWMSNRKKILCKTCKGSGKVACPACKGTGKDILREPYTGRPIRIEKCKYCDARGWLICKKCRNGLNAKFTELVFWGVLPPKRREKLAEEFGSKEKFLEWLSEALSGKSEKHAGLVEKLKFVGRNKHVSFEILRFDFNEERTEATVSVRLKKNLSQKKEDRIVERLRWVKEAGKWHLELAGD